ncbi:MAG TPA: OmpA family protein [Allosphingosinicella sp.]|jgi:outer membrane protein OmpA-like peptidoglycan-associated protein
MRVHWAIAAAALAFASGSAAHADAPCRIGAFPPNFPALDLWMVFFDWDKATIGRNAAMVLDNLAATWRGLPLSQCPVEIVAYTDSSGPAGYNLALSRRRAEAVAAYLRRQGVNSEIRAMGQGESRLLVETRDGVREPQNRRAGILIVPNP